MEKNSHRMTKRELIREISDKTELKSDVVKSVLNAFTDIFIREVIVYGRFALANCFSINTTTRKEHTGYNMTTGKKEIRPETKHLSMRLSRKINYLFRWKIRNERNLKNGVSPENWRDAYKEIDENA